MRTPLLYFLTGEAKPPAYAIDHLGRIARKEPASGPGERTGALAAPCAGSAEYFPEAQRWARISGDDEAGVWLGVETGARLNPADLARETQRPGHRVTLGDGQEWEIPVARLAAGGCGLPRRRVLREDGSRGWEVEAAYRELSEFGDRVWRILNGEAVQISDDEAEQMFGAALSVNYRLHAPEAVALGLVTDTALRAVLRALVDWPTIERILAAPKKAESPSPTAA